ncbi:HNH endonuclease signature motif containing protein [Dactylosporangium sucinum]|uniref:HNH endonuclease n=1 Tax=Dactylosporangium sucinum TaxID=1424081 RepID=A0A917X7L9_9ACTN|nr:HNH endonuclease signature motif containing protein [Dactylosporangium sucinum]GGM90725.1 hypothetical protein GCM10007977_110930 [Dactylosporangium sucinum]
MEPYARLLGKVAMGPDGCWIYTGSIQPRSGYGSFGVSKGKSMPAHRAAYQFAVGPIPHGAQLDHECHTRDTTCPGGPCLHRRCVNPDHLAPVTSRENTLRSRTSVASLNAAKTHCTNGHPFTAENIGRGVKAGRTYRECKTCKRARDASRRKAA